MKSNYTIYIILGLLILIGVVAFISQSNKADVMDSNLEKMENKDQVIEDEAMEPKDEMTETEEATESNDSTIEDDEAMMPQGVYVNYTPEKLSQASGTRRILYFYANWCPTCKVANEDLENNFDKLPKDVSVIRVNYNDTDTDQNEKDLAKKYGITYQHTFVQIDENGEALVTWNGGEIDELLTMIK